MWDELRDTPEVVWGFAIALGIVLLLTPAIGQMARRIGAVDVPEPRRLNEQGYIVPGLGDAGDRLYGTK